ncbi:heavy-metal-associated domain-containing protein [Flavobacterium sp.]|uniref:heavy-metal-associated domain-containing protein n=1 Tax=Flavobacterium sp. TaxID=239 RepID=UPI003751BC34
MKNIKIALGILIVTSSIFVSCKKENVEDKTESASVSPAIAKAETTSFNVEGMTCAMGCAKTIENKLVKLEGVQKATVDFDKKTATIQYDATLQTPEKLVETVEAVADGKTYKVSNVKSSADKAMLYQENPVQEKPKKVRKSKKANLEASTETATATPVVTEKKAGCCAAKKACSEKPATM